MPYYTLSIDQLKMGASSSATRKELADIARQAASHIEQRGFTKGVYADDTGAVCHNGALLLAVGSSHVNMLTMEQALSFWKIERACISLLRRQGYENDIKACAGRDKYLSHLWNDLPETTAEDVILLFKNVAQELEEA